MHVLSYNLLPVGRPLMCPKGWSQKQLKSLESLFHMLQRLSHLGCRARVLLGNWGGCLFPG